MKHLFAMAFILLASQARAQFLPAEEETLYLDFPELSLEYVPRSEFRVHAIVNGYTNRVMYVITWVLNDGIVPFGTFECGLEFTYLDSSTNGFRDIRCVTYDAWNNPVTTILRVMSDAGYEGTLP